MALKKNYDNIIYWQKPARKQFKKEMFIRNPMNTASQNNKRKLNLYYGYFFLYRKKICYSSETRTIAIYTEWTQNGVHDVLHFYPNIVYRYICIM